MNGFDRFEERARLKAEGRPAPKAPTAKQRVARARNWGVRNLRAFYALSYAIGGERGDAIRALIDDELKARGAMTSAEKSAAVADEPLPF